MKNAQKQDNKSPPLENGYVCTSCKNYDLFASTALTLRIYYQ